MVYAVLTNNQGGVLFKGNVEDEYPEEFIAKHLYGENALVYYHGSENDVPLVLSVYYEDKQCRCTKVVASGLTLHVE